jgi:hypothetical protein
MRTATCLALALLLPPPPATAGEVPPAKQSLEALKGKLPGVVSGWGERQLPEGWGAQLRRVRMVGEAEAKVTVRVRRRDAGRSDEPPPEYLLVVSLRYYDGLWTAVRAEWSDPDAGASLSHAGYVLLDAIDEAAEK